MIRTNKLLFLYTVLLCLFSFLLSFDIYGQEIRTFTIEWSTPEAFDVNGTSTYIPNFKGQTHFNGKLAFQYMEEVLPKTNASFELTDIQTSPANEKEIKYLQLTNTEILETAEWKGTITNGGNKRLLVLSLIPFIKKGGTIHRITSISVQQNTIPYIQNYQAKSFATESVLRPGTGSWYKIAVTQDGIYKIDRNFLSSIGVDVNNLNPQHIHIYGNGDGRIPELNSAPRTDDLAMNAIFIQGESDGSFDNDDYILFYGAGPHRWDLSSSGTSFVNERNIYSDQSCYFININPNVAPVRIQDLNSTTLPASHTVNSYSFRAVHENDLINLNKCGQRWYGETFDVELSRTFSFPISNPVPNTPSSLIISMGSDSRTTSNGTINYIVNGTTLLSDPVPSNGSGYYGRSTRNFSFNNSNPTVSVNIVFQRNNPSITAYLDKIELNTRRQLVFTGNQFSFRDLESTGAGNISEFLVQNFPATGFIWDVSNRHMPRKMIGQLTGGGYVFRTATDNLKEFVASNGNSFLTPSSLGTVNPQNLHALSQVDYLIISPSGFTYQANRLADLHRQNGLSVHVVNVDEIYNEFSSGAIDAAAIRTFIKMFYDRTTSPADALKYVCLFGDGSYDPKNRVQGNNNFIPAYQLIGSSSNESSIENIVTDDFYGILDDAESMDANSIVDMAIGRLLISNIQMAREQVNKIEHYMKGGSNFYTENNVNCVDGVSSSSFGDWRTKLVNVADMEDWFIVNDHEPGYTYTKANHPDINTNKLYLDAYQLEATVSGNRSSELNTALLNSFYSGSLVINYVGHGGVGQLSDARIITTNIIQDLRNSDRLPLFVSATCEFTRFDNPELVSAGEWMSINPLGGAIALMTTTRTIYYGTNTSVVGSFNKNVFKRRPDNTPRTFGDILLNTKVDLVTAHDTYKMAFVLIGDPALRIGMPQHRIVIDSINGVSPALLTDTVKALSKVQVKAHLEDFNGNILSSFNGIATPSLYDKPKQLNTRGQKPGPGLIGYANQLPFELQKNVIYRGQSTITNGYFSFDFIVPKDIDYSYGNGKFSMYADNGAIDAVGEEQRVLVGGVNPLGLNDEIGPEITMYLNNENFVNGGLTDETPYLIAKIKDENGVNTVGNGIGHDITAVIDEKTSNPIILNEYFKNDLDTYQSGELRYQLSKLEPGRHTLTLKVWDVNNNSSQETVEFIVQEKSELALDHVLNYPNPFTTNTEFYFEHNQCCTELETQIQIFTVSGRLVKTINKTIFTQGYRSEGIQWDGRDDFGDDLARGVYVYRLKVRTPAGEIAEKLEKLVLL